MVSGRRGGRLVTLKGGEPAYRMLVEAMSEGAAALTCEGALLYCNRRFAELLRRPAGKILGRALESFIEEAGRERLRALLAGAPQAVTKGEFNLRSSDGSLVPIYLSINSIRRYEGLALGMVITDLSEQKRRQLEEIKQAEAVQRLLLERVLSAQEEERRRVARELHDEAGQLLTSLLVGLRSLEHLRSLADVKSHGRRLRETTAHAIDEVGRLARGLHPSVLDDHGLGVALSRYAAEYAATHRIVVDLRQGELDSSNLSSAVQIGLYRILQEALTNVARHSGAKAVSIRFACSPSALEVAVRDNGCGFDTKAAAVVAAHRLGMQGMRERAAMLGGTVSFTSNGKGTKIHVHIPVAKQGFQPAAGEPV
jgi:PAS domain S-box-containing protein